MISSPELLSSGSVTRTSDVEPSQTADNTSNELTISDNPQDATTSETVP